jgi:hypothetical protein
VTARQRGRSAIPGSSLRNQVAHDRRSLSTLRWQPGQETETCSANEDEFAAMICEPCSSSIAYSFQRFDFPSIKACSNQRALHSPVRQKIFQCKRSGAGFAFDPKLVFRVSTVTVTRPVRCMLGDMRLELQWAPERHHDFFPRRNPKRDGRDSTSSGKCNDDR